jgi:hypothetical protein
MVAEALAKRVGREPSDLTVRVWTGALFGGLMAAVFAAPQDGGDVMEYVDRSTSQLEEHGPPAVTPTYPLGIYRCRAGIPRYGQAGPSARSS